MVEYLNIFEFGAIFKSELLLSYFKMYELESHSYNVIFL
jgi:hypothetical protein